MGVTHLYILTAQVHKLLFYFSLVILSFVSLIYKATVGEPKIGGGIDFSFPTLGRTEWVHKPH